MYYDQPLEFGTFLTPTNDDPQRVVALAQLSEQLGYDIVTIQDHPYQSKFLDTWTLLSWIAARTTRIRLAGNVINLALRPPTVLARSAASLDLLSHGRFEMGLGAGAFWDAIASVGGPRRTPAEAVESVDEAIDIFRQMWDPDTTGSVSMLGEIYQIPGTEAGPRPHHTIPIWLGASKPKMLRLIGRKADGLSLTISRFGRDEFRRMNAIIDEAARGAQRDPADIRRILNVFGQFTDQPGDFLVGPPEKWVQDLLPLAAEDGASTFILGSDDPATLTRFAQEVIPALREAVRIAQPTMPISRKWPANPSKRMPGIAYDAIPASLRASAIEPGDARYGKVRSNYLRGGAPGLILYPSSPEEVAEAIAFAHEHRHLPFSVRSRGHGISGRSTNRGGIIIDVSKLNRIEILDEATRRVRIGPGARWVDVAEALEPHGWALTSGDYGGVGVGGLATAGGVGWFAREHGLTLDHMRAAEIVLADGSIVQTNATENADLFWAIRGAGANFGIVTSFEFEVDEVGQVGLAQLVLDAEDTAGFLEQWGRVIETSPRDLTASLIMSPARGGQPMTAMVIAVVDSSDPETIIRRLQPIADISPMYDQRVTLTTYAGVMNMVPVGDHTSESEPISRSGLVRHITPEVAQAAENLLKRRQTYFFQIRSMGGAVADVPSEATAFANRAANFSIVAMGSNKARLDAGWDEIAHLFSGLYLSFETDTRPERIAEAFPGATLDRLRALKATYDPTNLFRDNFNVTPQAAILL